MKYCPYCRKSVNVKRKKIYPLFIIVILLWGVTGFFLNIIDRIENQTILLILWWLIIIATLIYSLTSIYMAYEMIRSKEKCEACGQDISKTPDFNYTSFCDELYIYGEASNERIININDHNDLYDEFYEYVKRNIQDVNEKEL